MIPGALDRYGYRFGGRAMRIVAHDDFIFLQIDGLRQHAGHFFDGAQHGAPALDSEHPKAGEVRFLDVDGGRGGRRADA